MTNLAKLFTQVATRPDRFLVVSGLVSGRLVASVMTSVYSGAVTNRPTLCTASMMRSVSVLSRLTRSSTYGLRGNGFVTPGRVVLVGHSHEGIGAVVGVGLQTGVACLLGGAECVLLLSYELGACYVLYSELVCDCDCCCVSCARVGYLCCISVGLGI